MEIHDKSQIKAALRQSFGAVVYALNEMDKDEFEKPRAEGKWSPGDILGHLILSTKPINKALSVPKLILKTKFGKNNRQELTLENLKLKYYEGLASGVKAPPNFIYNGVSSKGKEAMLASFTTELNQLLNHIDNWSEKDLNTYLLPHPAIGKLTLREMLFFTHFHTLHHLQQINVVVGTSKT